MGKVSKTESTPETNRRNVCNECIGDDYLKKIVNRYGRGGKCTYCDKEIRVIALENLAKHVKRFFDDHFIRDIEDPYHPRLPFMKEMHGNIAGIIETYANVDIEIAQDLQIQLRHMHFNPEDEKIGYENPFDENAFYNEKEVSRSYWNFVWSELKRSILEENRMFNAKVKEILDSVFGGSILFGDNDDKERSNIVEVGPDKEISSLFRAREFQSDEKLYNALCYPDRELGPPPSPLAAAGRMNAEGVAVFYGATKKKVALAEIRPAVGSRVVVGRFDITRHLRLLDLVSLRDFVASGISRSYFKPSKKRILEKMEFLSSLCERISAPVVPQDEAADYLVTQAISDYLSELDYPTTIDGLIYHSAQTGSEAENVVLFHKSSRVEYRSKPKESTVSEQHEDSSYPDIDVKYVVLETKGVEDKENKENVDDLYGYTRSSNDKREVSLKLKFSSISVHQIRRVKVKACRQHVSRIHAGKDKLFDDHDY